MINYLAEEILSFWYKSSYSFVFRYKTHLAISDERIITAAVITTGEKNDGKYLQELITKSEETGIKVNTVVGDTAYSSRENIKYTKDEGIDLISKLHPIVSNGSRKENDGFTYNKDAGMYMCKAGFLAKSKKLDQSKSETRNPRYRYMFDVKNCKVCPFREGCYKDGAKTKSYYVA